MSTATTSISRVEPVLDRAPQDASQDALDPAPQGVVESTTAADFAAYVELRNALERHDAGQHAVARPAASVALGWRRPTSYTVGLLSRDAATGAPAGMAHVVLFEQDNTHLLDVELYVRPEHRRRGHGRALLAAVEATGLAAGRDTALTVTALPVSSATAWSLHEAAAADPTLSRTLDPGEQLPAVRFARAAGYDLVQTELRTEVRLPHDPQRLAAIEAEAVRYARGYRTVTWRGRPPRALLADRAELAERMSTDPPLGEIDFREEHWSIARLEASYDDAARRGVETIGAGAVETRTGRLVAFSEIAVDRHLSSAAFQEDTIVLPEHRGHRLGLVVKAANLRAVSGAYPDLTRVVTYNALENGPMLRVNRAIGFEPTVLYPLWQGRLGTDS